MNSFKRIELAELVRGISLGWLLLSFMRAAPSRGRWEVTMMFAVGLLV